MIKRNLTLSFVLSALVSLAGSYGLTSSAVANEVDDCKNEFSFLAELEKMTSNPEQVAILERHSLTDLPNLIEAHPGIVMNAFQRAYAHVMNFPVRKVKGDGYGLKENTVYSLFSGDENGGLPEANGRLMVGNLDVIHSVVEYLRQASAGGSERARYNLFVGPPGTGKSEILAIMLAVAKSLELNQKEYFRYTYQWINLDKIPTVEQYMSRINNREGNSVVKPYRSPINESPFALLPKSAQDLILARFGKNAERLIGSTPDPKREVNPHDDYIRSEILKHYQDERISHAADQEMAKRKSSIEKEAAKLASQRNMSPELALDDVQVRVRREVENALLQDPAYQLTDSQAIEYLAKHTEVIRVWVGQDGAMPLVNGQEKEVDYNGLLVGENPIFFDIQGNPFAHKPGKVAKANGGYFFFDEFFRFAKPFRDELLSFIQEGTMSRQGSAEYPLDLVLFMASNIASVDKERKAENPNPLIDRAKIRDLSYSVFPRDIAKTLVAMRGKSLAQSHLDPEKGPKKPMKVQVNQIWPVGEKTGLSKRFILWVKNSGVGGGARDLRIEPHTLEYMSEVAAATRMVFDPSKAAAAGAGQIEVINRPEFTNPIMRLKVITGDLPTEAPIRAQIETVSKMVKEGSTGLTQRHLTDVWFSAVVEKAASMPLREAAITPALAKSVFEDLLNKGEIDFGGDTAVMELWKNLSKLVFAERVVPWIKKDFINILSDDQEYIHALYDEIFAQLSEVQDAFKQDAPLTYRDKRNERVPVDKTRLREIAEIYYKETGRQINVQEMFKWAQNSIGSSNSLNRRSEDLLLAIQIYAVGIMGKVMSASSFLGVLEGDSPQSEGAQLQKNRLRDASGHLGYSVAGLESALRVLAMYENMEKANPK
jgi:hypothetical protein